MSGPYRATRPLLRPPRAHRLRCARGRPLPVRAHSHCDISAALVHPHHLPFAADRRPARRCRTAIRSRSASPRLQSPHAALAPPARAAACAPACTPCPRLASACEGAIRGRSGVELCLGWPPPIRYFERSRSGAVGSSQHACFPPRPRPCDTPARAARQRGLGTRTAAPRAARRVFALGKRDRRTASELHRSTHLHRQEPDHHARTLQYLPRPAGPRPPQGSPARSRPAR